MTTTIKHADGDGCRACAIMAKHRAALARLKARTTAALEPLGDDHLRVHLRECWRGEQQTVRAQKSR